MNEEDVDILRTREAIENKMRAKDYSGSRSLIFEALKVHPTLDRGSEMLAVCEILCAAEMELPVSGIDCYWVLQLFDSASPAAIEAQYQKTVTQLNLIKDDFPGTELAIKFAADAFSVLSDPVKRAEFDSKRNTFLGMSQDSNPLSSSRLKRAAGEVSGSNGHVDEQQKKKICALEASWVMDQVNSYNDNLQKASGVSQENHLASKQPVKDFYDFENNRKAEHFSVGQIWAAYDQEHMPRRYGKINKILPQKLQFYVTWFKACPQQSREKKWQDASFPIVCGTFRLELNKMTRSGPSMFSYMLSNGITVDPLDVYPKKGEVWAIYKDWDIEWCSDPAMGNRCAFEIVEILADCLKDSGAKVAFLVRVPGFKNVFQRYSKRGNELSFQIPGNKLLMFSHKVPAFRFVGGEIGGISNGMLELDPLAVPDNLVQDFSCAAVVLMDPASKSNEEQDCSHEASITNLMNPSIKAMDTGGSNSRAPKNFVDDQVWAVYDGPDAMPRTYVKINDVVSPTKVAVTFLEPHPMCDEEIKWVEEDLPIVCGIFRAGRATSNLEMSKFSHLVQCDKSLKRSYYRIFPRKGEIWAMYRNWNINWSSALSGYECQVVEILSDFSEENGVRICSLTEVPGCLTLFQRQLHDGFELTKQLSRFELLSLSHRIPAFTVIGIKHHDIPKGSLHLEPDALPPKSVS